MMADVFLSYSQKDRPAVDRIAAALNSLGLSVWYDARLNSGSSFDEMINAELREAKAILVLWSPTSIASKWPRAEAMLAYDKHKLAAAFLSPCELTPPFNLVHTSNLSDWSGEAAHPEWRSVVRAIANLCGRPGVGSLAEALATGTPESMARWAQQFPDELLAKEMWESRSLHLRLEFAADLQTARAELATFLDQRRQEAELILARASEAFEAWLDAERLGKAAQRPDPGAMIGPVLSATNNADPGLRAEIQRLKGDLGRATKRADSAIKDLDKRAPSADKMEPSARTPTDDASPGEASEDAPGDRLAKYAPKSLIILGAICLAATSLFSLLVLWSQSSNGDAILVLIIIAVFALDVATISAGVAAQRRWRRRVYLGLSVCVAGCLVDILAAVALIGSVTTGGPIMNNLAFTGDAPHIAAAYAVLARIVALAGHGPGLIYFGRLQKQRGATRPPS
jgi:hypothetical protein